MTTKIETTLETLTGKEIKLLRTLFVSSRENGHDFGFTEDARGVFADPKTHPGVLASLQEKGIIQIFDPETNENGTWTQFIFAAGGMDPDEEIIEAVEGIIAVGEVVPVAEVNPHETRFIVRSENPTLLCGRLVHNRLGWIFLTNVSGHGDGRTRRAVMEQAIPRWARKGTELMTSTQFANMNRAIKGS